MTRLAQRIQDCEAMEERPFLRYWAYECEMLGLRGRVRCFHEEPCPAYALGRMNRAVLISLDNLSAPVYAVQHEPNEP